MTQIFVARHNCVGCSDPTGPSSAVLLSSSRIRFLLLTISVYLLSSIDVCKASIEKSRLVIRYPNITAQPINKYNYIFPLAKTVYNKQRRIELTSKFYKHTKNAQMDDRSTFI